ncbi:uncharacterized protein BJX67DRAFT_346931 [Aspergillus lucknowensis]|uniref:Uncharacterized protein n=1 Tax=Aspergillus lucknowensis TaxID=176173 RepID=A0ABR4LYZ0_9EURO
MESPDQVDINVVNPSQPSCLQRERVRLDSSRILRLASATPPEAKNHAFPATKQTESESLLAQLWILDTLKKPSRHLNLSLSSPSVSEKTTMSDPRIPAWREILSDDTKSWVLFEHGTCVIFVEPDKIDLAAQAREILSKWGPVYPGSSAGDFNIIELEGPPGGWVVTGHHPDVLNYVSPGDVEKPDTPDFVVGMMGRSNRDEDGKELKVVHVEDNRG